MCEDPKVGKMQGPATEHRGGRRADVFPRETTSLPPTFHPFFHEVSISAQYLAAFWTDIWYSKISYQDNPWRCSRSSTKNRLATGPDIILRRSRRDSALFARMGNVWK